MVREILTSDDWVLQYLMVWCGGVDEKLSVVCGIINEDSVCTSEHEVFFQTAR